MKKILVFMLVVAMLTITSLAFAGGGQVQSDNGEGNTWACHIIDDDAPGNVWWDD